MADFRTHLGVAAAGGAVAAHGGWQAGLWDAWQALAVLAGALLLQGRLDTGGLLLACGAIYLAVRHLAGALFSRFTVHRGLWHSLLAAGLCGLVTTALSHRLLAQPDTLAWAHGVALSLGFVIHLTLDELYSVDLTGARIKRSFGTALKPFDWRSPGNSLVMLLAAVNLLPWLPAWETLWSLLAQGAAIWR